MKQISIRFIGNPQSFKRSCIAENTTCLDKEDRQLKMKRGFWEGSRLRKDTQLPIWVTSYGQVELSQRVQAGAKENNGLDTPSPERKTGLDQGTFFVPQVGETGFHNCFGAETTLASCHFPFEREGLLPLKVSCSCLTAIYWVCGGQITLRFCSQVPALRGAKLQSLHTQKSLIHVCTLMPRSDESLEVMGGTWITGTRGRTIGGCHSQWPQRTMFPCPSFFEV